MLRMIAGLTDITAGQLEFDGTVVNGTEPKERDIAFVFQSYALYPHLTVRANIAFPLLMSRFKPYHHLPVVNTLMRRRVLRDPDVDAQVRRVAEMMELTDYLDRRPRTLSGGQRQRVAVGRALIREPSMYLARRTAEQSRRHSALPDAGRDQRAAPAGGQELRLRHARPGRGHDHGDAHHRAQRGRHPAVRDTEGDLRQPSEHVRGQVHRQPADEPDPLPAGRTVSPVPRRRHVAVARGLRVTRRPGARSVAWRPRGKDLGRALRR